MSALRDATSQPRGAWCCPHCKGHRTKTLHGMNLHLFRKHGGEGFGIYRTADELKRKAA